jgi:preprotein translocase subunit SecE
MADKTSPTEFIQQVREETAKVTWPSRKEVMISTVMVLIMVALASVFFLVVDAALKWIIEGQLLGIAS